MLELRILNGYHRGATLPLGAEPLAIGGSEDADVVLADPGLAGHHARLSPEGGAWVLEPVDGTVRGDLDNTGQDRIPLGDGSFARVGPIWLTVCAAASPWADPPPEPADPAPLAAADMQDDAPLEPEPVAEPVIAQAPVPEPARVATPRRARGSRMILVPVTAVAVLSAAAAYAWTAHPATVAAVSRHQSAAPRQMAPAQLQEALRRRLAEIDLLARVTLELQDHQWTIRASLGDEESERLQRMLHSFEQRYVIDFPVHVRIGSPETMLPFRINQVLSGADPSIVLDDGRRLYVGDEYRGVRLAAVAGNQLRFTGKQNLDVVW